jgi:hypothetical protein
MAEGNQKQTVRVMAWAHMGSANKQYPESEETIKGHGHKTRRGLLLMKTTTASNDDNNHDYAKAIHLPWPVIRQKEAIIKV